jgi:hypothetical protein
MRRFSRGTLVPIAACVALGLVAACSDLLGITPFTGAEEDSGAPATRDGSSSSGGEPGSEGGSGSGGGSDSGSTSGSDTGGNSIISLSGYATAGTAAAAAQTLSPTLTWAQSTGDLIVLLINYTPGLSLSQIRDVSGNVYTQLGAPVSNMVYGETMFYCLSAKAAGVGANTVTVSLSAVSIAGDFSVAVFGFAAPGHTWTQDQYVNNSQTNVTAVTTGNVTTTYANEVLISGTGVDHYTTMGSGDGWIAEPPDGLDDMQEYLIVSSIQTDIAATYTQSPQPGKALSQLGTFAARP